MRIVSTAEDLANPFGKLIGTEQPLGLRDLRLPWIHFDSIGLSHGLLVGNRHGTIRTPRPLALIWRL